MAGVGIGSEGGKKRATNSEINMIPFIDLLMVTIAFLLITAVWTTNSRINADAQVPGQDKCVDEGCIPKVEKKLHVHVGETEFSLVWKQAGTVVSETRIPKTALEVGDGTHRSLRYPDLAALVEKEWSKHALHVDPSDRAVDQAILHSDNRTSFREIVAVLDAIHGTHRSLRLPDGKTAKVPAFNLVFASN